MSRPERPPGAAGGARKGGARNGKARNGGADVTTRTAVGAAVPFSVSASVAAGARGRFGSLLRRADPQLSGARALAAVGAVAAVLAGVFFWSSRPRPEPVTATAARPAVSVAEPAAGPSATASVMVHVAGKVRRPGVVTLPAGARVAAAIRAAGGLRPRTGVDDLNLARPVVDGEQILVGVTPPPGLRGPSGPPVAPGTAPGAGQPPPAGGPGSPADRLDLNTATLEQFQELPGVGPVLAQRIIDHRTSQGGFRSVDQLQEVTGIGARRFAELRDRVRV